MKRTPTKWHEWANGTIHCDGPDGNDFTLCGFTLDGDQGKITEIKGRRINCVQCLAIIRLCQSITVRSLPRSDREADARPEREQGGAA